MQSDIQRVLISQEQIAQRVRELAGQITADHAPHNLPEGGEITIVPILTGAFIFCGDLIRQIPLPIRIGLLTIKTGALASGDYTTMGPEALGMLCFVVAGLICTTMMAVPVIQLALGLRKQGALIYFAFGPAEWRLGHGGRPLAII